VRRVVLLTGLQAAGKTTIGRLLAERLRAPAANFDGDVLFDMVAAGRAAMTPTPTAEALRQLRLRYESAAMTARHYVAGGFDFVYSDIILGRDVVTWMDSVPDAERHLVVLAPSDEVIMSRERARGTDSYRNWIPPDGTLSDAVAAMSALLDETPRRGLWLDTSADTPAQTVERILAGGMRASRY
jgi:chloramphenicol 3-O-phosphotransferase